MGNEKSVGDWAELVVGGSAVVVSGSSCATQRMMWDGSEREKEVGYGGWGEIGC